MTGGGFGGCTVNLVRARLRVGLQRHLARTYRKATGIAPDVYICEPAQGDAAWPMQASIQV
jgi:galactokinase